MLSHDSCVKKGQEKPILEYLKKYLHILKAQIIILGNELID